MADWKQIQARIRKAKNSADPLTKLGELFEKTRDAMVAWEIGVLEEKAGRAEEAIRRYTTAFERFRRADWKKKAEEALLRLGVPLPVASAEGSQELSHREITPLEQQQAPREPQPSGLALGEIASPHETEAHPAQASADLGEVTAAGKRRRRRGRRGGRGRRGRSPAAPAALPSEKFATLTVVPVPPPHRELVERSPRAPVATAEIEPPPVVPERPTHGRAGEPALASRLAHLEALLRRLISSPLHRIDEADEAPAGPGVFLLSDSDLVTSYYIENCRTLRVALGQLARGGRGGARGGGHEGSVRGRLAEHLGISEAKVSKYLKDHCLIRWLQLDEEAPNLAHFAIAVLKPPLNAE
jgi:hypothetical protein